MQPLHPVISRCAEPPALWTLPRLVSTCAPSALWVHCDIVAWSMVLSLVSIAGWRALRDPFSISSTWSHRRSGAGRSNTRWSRSQSGAAV